MNKPAVDTRRVNREVWQDGLSGLLFTPEIFLLVIVITTCIGWFFPATWLLSGPFLVLCVPIVLGNPWRMPMRMPATMNRPDPSTDIAVRYRFVSWLPFGGIRIRRNPGAGILYLGFQRLKDAGRELWLSMDDLTRHTLFLGTTGAGKTEFLLGVCLNALCWGKGFSFTDGKAQNDVAFAIGSLARRFGREDDVRYLNFITGGRSRAQALLDNDRRRPQTNTINNFAIAQETFIIQLMQSMLPQVGSSDGGWQEKAKAMIQAMVMALCYLCRREQRIMSQRILVDYLPLKKVAQLYCQAVDEQWHDDARLPLENYLNLLAGFDISQVRRPSEWAPEALQQHGYLIQQFTRMLTLFNDTYGHVFAEGAGDVELRDCLHNDRIVVVLIPALELESEEAATLGRLYYAQMAMILSQDLGEKIEGPASDILVIRKFKDRFPFLIIGDEIGATYTDKIGELATQIRSLGYGLFLAGQDLQRLIVAAGKKTGTLLANMGTRIAGTTVDPEETLQVFSKAGGREFRAEMAAVERREGVIDTDWGESDQLQLREHDRIDLSELQALRPGEIVTLFKGEPVRGAALYIADHDKLTRKSLHINRFIEVPAPTPSEMWEMLPHSARKCWPSPSVVSHLRRILGGYRNTAFVRYSPEHMTITDDVLCRLADEEDRMAYILDTPRTQRGVRLYQTALNALRDKSGTRGRYRAESTQLRQHTLPADVLRHLVSD
ncbi:F-type conjugative transfer protein TrbC [Klebsiella oxytoca]|uniref:F-type conjugative transfer protein TrbC n=1 Tax=Klebsiella oxytoca TaxID=571 RepID=UPI001B341019|nr:F-type conjugative transfer protein TrbC [Klebsiella oxytoca]